MDNNQEKQNKLPMTESGERELRLYYFITKFLEELPGGAKKMTEGVATILSFDLDRAVAEASVSLPLGTNIVMAGNKKVSEIMAMVETVTKNVTEKKEYPKKETPKTVKELGILEFKSSLLLAADMLIKNERDKKTIIRIVNSI